MAIDNSRASRQEHCGEEAVLTLRSGVERAAADHGREVRRQRNAAGDVAITGRTSSQVR